MYHAISNSIDYMTEAAEDRQIYRFQTAYKAKLCQEFKNWQDARQMYLNGQNFCKLIAVDCQL